MTNIKAAEGKVVVRVDKSEDTIGENGLIIPENARKRNTFATVVHSNHPDVAEGDHVALIREYAGADFTVDGVTYTTVVPDEILGVLQ